MRLENVKHKLIKIDIDMLASEIINTIIRDRPAWAVGSTGSLTLEHLARHYG